MAATKALIVLVGASVLLVSQQERGLWQKSSVSWAGQAGLKSAEVVRDRLKSGGDGPEMVFIPSAKFRMGGRTGRIFLTIMISFVTSVTW